MAYNMNFLVAALGILLLVWHHFINSRKLNNHNSRIFHFFMLLGILDILFDIITTVLIMDGKPDMTGLTGFLLTFFYLLQVIVPYSLFLYTWYLCEQTHKAEKVLFWFLTMPAVLMGMVVLLNIKNGMLFRIDETGEYIKGPFYLSMYCYAFAYGVLILVCSIWRYRKLGAGKFGIILEFLIIMGGCVGIQTVRNDMLMTGFGLGLGILVLYLTINNPSDYTDRLTGLLNNRSFREQMQQLYSQNRPFHIIVVDLPRLSHINLIFGSKFGDLLLNRIVQELWRLLESDDIFRLSGKRFAMVFYALNDYEKMRKKLVDFLKERLELEGEYIQIAGIICGIINAQELKDFDILVSYADYLISLAPASMDTILLQSDSNTLKGFLNKKEIERFLCTAIEEDLFEVCYQPVFSVEKGEYITAEAIEQAASSKAWPDTA